MKKYKVIYISTTDNDCCSVSVNANDTEDAEDRVRDEYWDVKEIVDCYPL